MSTLGQFLELSLPAPDLAASLDFWQRLGLAEVRVNDIRPAGYAAVTDGQVVIGLYATGLDEPALTFVKPDLARHARALVDAGTELEFLKAGDDQFNEAGLRTPDGHLVLLLEAPTFSVTDDDPPAPVIGRCPGLALATGSVAETRSFFESAGFLGVEDEDDDAVLVTAEGISLMLRSAAGHRGVELHFEPAGPWREQLEARGIATRPHAGTRLVTSPEGLRLLLK